MISTLSVGAALRNAAPAGEQFDRAEQQCSRRWSSVTQCERTPGCIFATGELIRLAPAPPAAYLAGLRRLLKVMGLNCADADLTAE
jgi:hypothetical protein